MNTRHRTVHRGTETGKNSVEGGKRSTDLGCWGAEVEDDSFLLLELRPDTKWKSRGSAFLKSHDSGHHRRDIILPALYALEVPLFTKFSI